MDFNEDEIAAYRAAGDKNGVLLVPSQTVLMRDYWRKKIPTSVFVPSFKGCTIGQAQNLCEYWGIDDTQMLNYSNRAFQAVTWIISLIFICVIVALSALWLPWGPIILGSVVLVFMLAKIVGHLNDKHLRFNDLRDAALNQ